MAHEVSCVCILAAGTGSRMGVLGETIPKALLPVERQAVLSHIFSKFPEDSEFIVAIGFKGDQIQEYVRIAHPELDVKFVNIWPFEGKGTGPGASLKACGSFIRRPFYVVCADTLWDEKLPTPAQESWVGIAPVKAQEAHGYCVVESSGEVIQKFRDKLPAVNDQDCEAFIGLFFIYNYQKFFEDFVPKTEINGELQLSEGLENFLKKSELKSRKIHTWKDVGTLEKYLKHRGCPDGHLDKSSEWIYFVKNKVVKFFSDPLKVSNRVKRSQMSEGRFPPLRDYGQYFYAYEFIPGNNLYEQHNPSLLPKLLRQMKNDFWDVERYKDLVLGPLCTQFYKKKTEERLKKYLERFPNEDCEFIDKFPWSLFEEGRGVFFHGDLQFGNVIYSSNIDRFHFIDWREDFAGGLEVGDWYYDLGKLYSGLLVDLQDPQLDKIDQFESYEEHLRSFASFHGLSFQKIKVIGALVLLNIAPLYSDEVACVLFQKGKMHLERALNEI